MAERDEYPSRNGESIARIDERTKLLELGFREVREDLATNYVTRDQFDPVRNIVYSLVGTILLSTFVAILALVIKS